MKKLLFFAAALLMFAVPAANAQNVNTANELKKLDKVDAEVADAKKGAKVGYNPFKKIKPISHDGEW